MQPTQHTTLLIIGGGPGGYVAAIRAGQLGIPTVLIEGQSLGGTCLNVGCIPSKALIHVAEQFHATQRYSTGTSPLGIKTQAPTLDIGQSVQWKNTIVDRLTSGVGALLKKNNVKVIHGWAKILDGKAVEVGGQRIECEHLLLATGSQTVDLPIPANAEIVIEGEVDPNAFMEEGPFGEYTGYYSGVGTDKRNFINVTAVTYRNNPVLWGTTVGRAVTDTHMTMALTYGATLWQQLTNDMKIPGIKSVYCPPEGAGRFLAIISVKQMYPGHADQVGTAAISTEMGAYGLKTVIVVDEDIDPWDIPRVLYAVSFRFQPNRCQIIKRGRSTPLDPSLPIDARDITGRIIIDATIPYEWKEKPIPIELDPETVKKIKGRWSELGF